MTLMTFTAMLNKQVGVAEVSSTGISWRAAGGVGAPIVLPAEGITKFQVTPATSTKAILKFDRADGGKALALTVVLDEDAACGRSDMERQALARTVLEEARALVINQRHWPCNSNRAATPPPPQSSSSSGKGKAGSSGSGGGGGGGGGWGRSVAGTSKAGAGARLAVGPASGEPGRKRARAEAAERDAEQKAREDLLRSDESLLACYREAVLEGKVVTDEEFWAERRAEVRQFFCAHTYLCAHYTPCPFFKICFDFYSSPVLTCFDVCWRPPGGAVRRGAARAGGGA